MIFVPPPPLRNFLWPLQDVQERLLIAVQKLEEKVETLEKERETHQQKIAKLETHLLQATLSKSTSSGSYIISLDTKC